MPGFKSVHDYHDFAHTVQSKRRFFYTDNVNAFLNAVSEGSKEREIVLPAGQTIWRAQAGSRDWQRSDCTGHKWVEDAPFPPERMIPTHRNPSEGRLNPRGIAYLYLANDKRTAISEVRPSRGSLVTVGQFKTVRSLKLVNFSKHDGKSGGWAFLLDIPVDQWDKLSQKQIDQAVWADIDNAFSLPVSPSDTHLNYIPTQVLAESVLKDNYDGIIYQSALSGNGYNIALFDIESAKFESAQLYDVMSVEYEFSEYNNQWFVKDDEYFTTVITDIRPVGDDSVEGRKITNASSDDETNQTC